jgi:flagellar biosynthesis protein FliR
MTYTLAEFLSINVFAWMLVFARVGTAFITLPGMGESFVTPRARPYGGVAGQCAAYRPA